jgi:hypothetical protein
VLERPVVQTAIPNYLFLSLAPIVTTVLYVNLHRRNHFRFTLALLGRIFRQALASAVMAISSRENPATAMLIWN